MCKYKFFQHKDCEYFPCHTNIPVDEFNCMFCYCPLYFLDDCGGNYHILNNGIKDCSNCDIPHDKEMYDYIISMLMKHMKKWSNNDE